MTPLTFAALQLRCQTFLQTLLTIPTDAEPAQIRLAEAMRYAALNGGKRMRAMLVYATGILLDVPLATLDYPAAAVELIHAYSLVHDDLPAMDNSPLRRGKPTCHLAFDEALAILAGDTMQSLAFEVLTKAPLPAETVLKMLRYLASASGLHGMAGGQAIDLAVAEEEVNVDKLTLLHALKTGQLITASVQLGVLCANLDENDARWHELSSFAKLLGFAFQIRDDVLDVITSGEILGKPQGLDVTNGKYTFIDILGVKGCDEKLIDLSLKANKYLESYQDKSKLLRELMDFTVNREY